MITIVRYFVNLFNNKQNDKLLNNLNNYEKNNSKKDDDWIVEQYNRNRDFKEMITNKKQIKK